MKPKSKKIGLVPFFIEVGKITVKDDNGLLYGRFGIDNLDDCDLTISIRDNGINEPLGVVSENGI